MSVALASFTLSLHTNQPVIGVGVKINKRLQLVLFRNFGFVDKFSDIGYDEIINNMRWLLWMKEEKKIEPT